MKKKSHDQKILFWRSIFKFSLKKGLLSCFLICNQIKKNPSRKRILSSGRYRQRRRFSRRRWIRFGRLDAINSERRRQWRRAPILATSAPERKSTISSKTKSEKKARRQRVERAFIFAPTCIRECRLSCDRVNAFLPMTEAWTRKIYNFRAIYTNFEKKKIDEDSDPISFIILQSLSTHSFRCTNYFRNCDLN